MTGLVQIVRIFLVAVFASGCAVATRSTSAPENGGQPAPAPQPARVMVVAVGRAPESLSSRPFRELRGPGSPNTAQRMFNAGLALNNHQEVPLPYLAVALPQLGTESWQLNPDGSMETTYKLRPGLTWQDGEALTSRDFVFAWQVFSTPELGVASAPPTGLMSAVEAVDPTTLRIAWKSSYATADDLTAFEFPPLPSHLLSPAYSKANWDGFVGLPFWLGEYVGAGPYRLTSWEPGAFLEGEAFAGHALGKAKIERVRIVGINDPNTAVANLLAGSVHVALDQAMKDEHTVAVEAQWKTNSGGSVVRSPVTIRATHFQMRPEYANPQAAQDLRIRQAIVHATERQAVADAVTVGGGRVAEILLLPQSEYYAEAYAATPKFPYDVQRADQLMADAGYRRDREGMYAGPSGRFAIEVAVTDSNPTEGTVLADVLRRSGFETTLRVIPRAQTTEPLIFANFSGLFDGAVNSTYLPNVTHFRASSIARPENRYLGDNYAGFNDDEFERLASGWDAALDRGLRRDLAVQLVRRLGDALPAYGLYSALYTITYSASVRGPGETATSTNSGWNIYQWEWTS